MTSDASTMSERSLSTEGIQPDRVDWRCSHKADDHRENRQCGRPRSDEADRIYGSTARTMSFGSFRLIPRKRLLLDGETPVRLDSRALDILIALVEARGELVTKDELMSRVWSGSVIEENALQFQISTLRKALGSARDFIKTIPGRGYCFVAEISTPGGPDVRCRPTAPVQYEQTNRGEYHGNDSR